MNQLSRMTIRSAVTAFAVIAVFTVAALLPLTLRAQNTYGSIVGIVTDPSGAVVPGATVTITNIGTGQVVKAQTDAGGKYSVQDLLPADYKVAVEKTSFKRIERADVPVEVGTATRIDLTLAVGNTSETVEVTTSTPLLQTDSSELNQQVEGSVVQQMPLNGRNVMNLVELAPGVIPTGSASGSTGLDQSSGRTAGGIGWNNYEIGGGIQGWSATYIDGVPNNLLGDNILALVPTQDAVQEFSVVSSDATADFGRFAGGVVNVATKHGTNAFHGSAYEYLRNGDFNANSWINNHNNVARAHWNQNQYGANASGPIKRDKAFFLFTWENFKAVTGLTSTTTVPTAAMQSGVFLNKTLKPDPAYVASDGATGCNVQPYTGQTVNGQTYASGGTYIANLYAAGSGCGDPLNEVLKEYWPAPNDPNGVGYNWILNTPLTNSQTQYNGRIDYAITSKQSLFGRYTYWKSNDGGQSVFGDVGYPAVGSTTPTHLPTNNAAPLYYTHQAVIGDSFTLNPTTVLDVRANYVRQTSVGNVQDSSVNEAQFDQYNPNKYYTALAPFMNEHFMPDISLSGKDSLYAFGGFTNYNANRYNTYSLSASLVKILGPHTLKVGAEARLMDNSGTPFIGRTSGYYAYDNTFTGDEFASFLMGYPSTNPSVQFENFQFTAGYSYYQGYYVMDDWQATRKLTLNLGLRYELPGAMAERNNKLAVLLPNTTDPSTGITGTEAQVNSSLYHPRTAVVEKYNLFAPRVGFAYRATESTVLHGGYGLSYIPDDLAGPNGFGTLPFLSVFNNAYTTVTVNDSSAAPTPLQTILGNVVSGSVSGSASAPLIQALPKPPANFMTTYGSLTSYKGQTLTAPVPYQNYPYVQQWNVALSHQFKGDWMAEASYTGLKGTNLPQIGVPPNNYFGIDEIPDNAYTSTGLAATGPNAGLPLTQTAASCPSAPGLAGQISVGQCLRPNPYYADMRDSARFTARQNYKSLQVTGEKRFGSSGRLMTNYTWSRNMSDTDTANQQLETTAAPHVGNGTPGIQDYNNLGGEYALIGYDVTNRFVLDYEVNLPFGKGQKYANNLSGPAEAIASGWAINGITIFQSGFPTFLATASANNLTSDWGGGQLRPEVIPGCNKKLSGGSQTRVLDGAWFNTNCFEEPASAQPTLPNGSPAPVVSAAYSNGYAYGDEPRTDPQLRADGIKNFDFAFQKSTPIFESSTFVFRAEFFNIMNRVQFAPPSPTVGASNFGQVLSQANNPRQIQLSARVNF